MNKLIDKIESLGWNVEKEGDNEYRISKFSPAGQDFGITINGECEKDLIDSIYSKYENFDVSEETYLWLDNTGHGINGAPYHMRELLTDMEACEQMIFNLYKEIS
ncbi:hypothetical protein [Bacillus sp. Marseille-P3800]|uniref:hypothetical protein n=1 Tax=Bacillus sp. Marseille-P3800 TaxID=2014782 RepID=UPI000C0747AA|nr:hypothetical protein [Bacillus sp. Marseille-P3800]